MELLFAFLSKDVFSPHSLVQNPGTFHLIFRKQACIQQAGHLKKAFFFFQLG